MVTLAAIQMVSGTDVEQNLATARRLVAAAAAGSAAFVALPEYFCLMGRHDAGRVAIGEAEGNGPLQQFLSGLAQQHAIWLLGGTIPIQSTDRHRVRNASCLYAPDGTLAARYDKVHLFSFTDARESYDEAVTLEAGTELVSTAVLGLRIGLSVCYDIRFPELYRGLNSQAGEPPLDLICAPSAFTHATGERHWEVLLRARAIENQCYVIAAAQGGQHANGRRTWGHSMIIDPWGDVLESLPEGEGVVCAELDPSRITSVRARLPALMHRRM